MACRFSAKTDAAGAGLPARRPQEACPREVLELVVRRHAGVARVEESADGVEREPARFAMSITPRWRVEARRTGGRRRRLPHRRCIKVF